MPIHFTCPHCQAKTLVDDRYAGKTGPCRCCSARIAIPFADPLLIAAARDTAAARAVTLGMAGGALLYGSVGVVLQVFPAIYSTLTLYSLGGSGWTLLLAPLVMTLALALAGGFIGASYFGLVAGLMQRNPQALRASMAAGLLGFLAGGIAGVVLSGIPIFLSGGGLAVWLANGMQTLLVTLGCASAAGFLASLVGGMANLPQLDLEMREEIQVRHASPPPAAATPSPKNHLELIGRVAQRGAASSVLGGQPPPNRPGQE